MSIIFGYFIDFKNEKELNLRLGFHPTAKGIKVIEKSSYDLNDAFSMMSEVCIMSGRNAYYYSDIAFEKSDQCFSWALKIENVMTLIWDSDKKTIFYIKDIEYSAEKLRFWVYHTFFPLVLELENKYHMIHVGAVEIEGMPVLFSAFSFGGKSTLTDYFLKKGHTLLSDDSLAVEEKDNTFYAVPSYPYHRPYREVETLGYYTENFARESKPIHVVYTLKKSDARDDVVITELKGIEKFKALHKSIFVNFDFMKKKHFEFLTKMAKDIPIYEITVPWDMERLEEVYEAICTHTNSLK